MSLSPSIETFWKQHQDTLKHIRSNLTRGTRSKSQSPLHSRYPQKGSQKSNTNHRTTSTPPYLTRLDTPPQHERLKSKSSIRGKKFNVVPPVPPKEAFVNDADDDSWGEESDSEDTAPTPNHFPYAVPVYPAPPAVIYPGQPMMLYPSYAPPPPQYGTKKQKKLQKKSVRFSKKPVDTSRMRETQLNPAYRSLYTGLGPMAPYTEDETLHRSRASREDLFDENKNPLLQKYKYIYPLEKSPQPPPLSRPVLSDLQENRTSYEIEELPVDGICEDILSEEVDVFIRELVKEATNELVDDYLDVRLTSRDPLEDFLTQLLNDGVNDALEVVVKETLSDMTEDALVFSGSCDVIDGLIQQEIEECIPEILSEVTLEMTLEEFIEHEVIRPEIEDESKSVADEVLQETDAKIRRREFKQISRHAQEKLADSLCLDYLLSLVSRQGHVWTESDFANRALDSMSLSVIFKQYFCVKEDRCKTLDNIALQKLHEKAVTGVALDVFLSQLTASLDEDLADVDEYECGISLPWLQTN